MFKLSLKKPFFIHAVMRGLLLKYVDWERMWYSPKCRFKKGDKLKLNWKAIVMGYEQFEKPIIFERVDKDGVVVGKDNDLWNIYWLRRA